MRGRLVALSMVVALLCAGCDWLQWGGGPQHSGGISETGLTTSNVPTLLASSMAELPATSSASTFAGLVFVEQDGVLRALDASTYGVVWTGALPAGATAGGTPAVDPGSGTVFLTVAASPAPLLIGFDVNGVNNCNTLVNSCSPTFSATLGSAAGVATPPLVDAGKVFANGATALYAFDASGQASCVPSQGVQVCSPLWSAPTAFSASGVGPAAANGVIYDAVATSGFALGAFDEGTGSLLWSGSLGPSAMTATPGIGGDGTVFAPANGTIPAFGGGGCGTATCAPAFALAAKTGDPAAAFLATPTLDGSSAYATNGNGSLYQWSASGCGAASCQPSTAVVLNTPSGGSTSYGQAVATGNAMLFVLARHSVAGTDRVRLVALDETNLSGLASVDLGPGTFAAGRASASLASGVVYAPVANALFAVHLPPVQPLASLSTAPLTLSPGFSPSTFDYTLPCASGANTVSISMTAVSGGTVQLTAPTSTQPSASQTDPVTLNENQAAVINATDANGNSAQYWIRCLPHDFPGITVTAHPGAGSPTPGWYLTGNLGSSGSSYAVILDRHGTPVWYKQLAQGVPINVTPVGKDTVAFMPGSGGFGSDPNGAYGVYNLDTGQTQSIATVGSPTDFHELSTLPNGDHLLLSYPFKSGVDLTGLPGNPAPGPNSTIADCVIQDVNPQGNLVWQWTASDHIDPVAENTFPAPTTINGQTVYDVYHCNSIDADSSGHLLLSVRHTNAVFDIRRSDGKIVWKLGGKPTNKDGAQIITIQNYPQGSINAQHDARYLPNGHVSLFDDQSFNSAPASGVEFSLNLTTGTAQPVFQFVSPINAKSYATGGFRRYSDGHSVVCWGFTNFSGSNPGGVMSEVDATGNDVLDIAFTNGNAAYRAVKAPSPRFDINVLRSTAGQ